LFNPAFLRQSEINIDWALRTGVDTEMAHTGLWRHCCLRGWVKKMSLPGEEGSGCDETYYGFCHTRDAGGATCAPRLNSAAREAGLIYWQAYLTHKALFDACKLLLPVPVNAAHQ